MDDRTKFIMVFGLKFIVALFLFFVSSSVAFAANPDNGKELFKANCATCHNKNMKDKLTGPALGNMMADWSAYPESDLYDWIRNSQAMIEKGHPRAVATWNEYKPVVMTGFPSLSDEDISDLIAYIDGTAKGTYGVAAAVPGAPGAGGAAESGTNQWVFWVLLGVLGLLALVLSGIIRGLNKVEKEAEGEKVADKTFLQLLTSKSVIGVVLFALIVLGGYTTVNNAIQLGRQQNYAPEQPIKFSHVTHAGINKIDCQFCHDGARRSKHSVIPSTNTCMSCHKAIKKGSMYGTEEITKIFASIGFDPNTDRYIDNYDAMSNQDVEKIYKKWIGAQYQAANSVAMDDVGRAFVDDQWKNIVNSLTNETKTKIQGPIEWIKVHNLPDHVYFNHAQHVAVGKVDCAMCHGKVEEMETLRQYSPLSMGWCINCHRETDVKFTDNPYYDSYTRFHEELKDGKRTSVKVEDIGGLECQKCHY